MLLNAEKELDTVNSAALVISANQHRSVAPAGTQNTTTG